MLSDKPIIQGINNSRLSAIMAMPIKPSTAAGDSEFSNNRRAYIDGYIPTPAHPLVKTDNHTLNAHTVNNAMFGFRGFSLINHNNTTQASTIQKKWINGSRDASQIIQNRRVNSVGNGSLNAANKPLSFMSNNQTNQTETLVARQTIRRSGSAAPAKKIYKHMDYVKLF